MARGISKEAVGRGEVETGKGGVVVFVEGTAEELEGVWREEGRKVDLLTASTAVCVSVFVCLFVVAALFCVLLMACLCLSRPTGSTCRAFMLLRPRY